MRGCSDQFAYPTFSGRPKGAHIIFFNTFHSKFAVFTTNCYLKHLQAYVRKNQIEMMYYEAAAAINMLGSDIDSSEISSSLPDIDHFPSPLQIYKQDSSTLLYKSGFFLPYKSRVSQKQFSCTDLCKCSNDRTTKLTK